MYISVLIVALLKLLIHIIVLEFQVCLCFIHVSFHVTSEALSRKQAVLGKMYSPLGCNFETSKTENIDWRVSDVRSPGKGSARLADMDFHYSQHYKDGLCKQNLSTLLCCTFRSITRWNNKSKNEIILRNDRNKMIHLIRNTWV